MEFKSNISRNSIEKRIHDALSDSPVTALLGARQCGKTWLARPLASNVENYFDLQNFVDSVRLEESNFNILDGLDGVVVIDEVQLKPELFQKLRVLADRPDRDTKFFITGSASPRIIKGVSESLAGRVRLIELGGFSIDEVGWDNQSSLWLRGGFPKSYLCEVDENSFQWRLDYISLFLGRDLPLLIDTKLSSEQLRRILQLIAHNHGQYWNHSEAAKIIGVSYKTVQRYVEILKGAFIIRELSPYYINIRKRLRKSPKIYLRDTGLLHALHMLKDHFQLSSHPKFGASWEGFCIEQIIRLTQTREEECFTWSVQGGEEIDLIINKASGLYGFEFKVGDAPRRSASMISALDDLKLKKLFIIYPGKTNYMLHDKIEAIGFQNLKQITSIFD